jgi:dihydrofolate reductase
MRTLAITQNITLDGSIEFLDNWFDPQARGLGDMADLQEEVQRQSAASDAMLLGRQTFEDFRSYWPHREDDTTGTSAYLDGVSKYVVSSTMTEPGWENTTVLAGDPVDEVRALKDTPGNDIVLTGSITLGHALIGAGVVDELRLFTYPVAQGRGRRLFPEGYQADRLPLLGTTSFASGIVLTTYAAAA